MAMIVDFLESVELNVEYFPNPEDFVALKEFLSCSENQDFCHLSSVMKRVFPRGGSDLMVFDIRTVPINGRRQTSEEQESCRAELEALLRDVILPAAGMKVRALPHLIDQGTSVRKFS